MAKNKTALYIGLGALGLGAIYLITKKPALTTNLTPGLAPATSSQSSNLIAQGSTLVSAISKLFGGGASSPAPGTAAAFAPVGFAATYNSSQSNMSSVSPSAGINYINPSAPSIPITAPSAPDSSVFDDGSVDTTDAFNADA